MSCFSRSCQQNAAPVPRGVVLAPASRAPWPSAQSLKCGEWPRLTVPWAGGENPAYADVVRLIVVRAYLQIYRMPTTLYPLTTEKLRTEALPLKDRIMAWRFFNAHGIDTTTQDGKRVAISGVKFGGST